jgi:hypothetical protein
VHQLGENFPETALTRGPLAKGRITRRVLLDAGVRWRQADWSYAIPRVSIEGEIVGWKHRNAFGGPPECEPSGIKNREVLPFCSYTRGVPSLVIWTEGETDALSLATHADKLLGHAASACTIYAIPGAGTFVPWWADLCRGKSVIVIPDGDEAGRNMRLKVAQHVPYARFVDMPDGMDICDMVHDELYEELVSLINAASTLAANEIPSRSYREHAASDIPAHIFADGLMSEVRKLTDLKRRGSEYAGLCPFHEERTPSFMVNPDKGVWCCHGCDRGGTLIDLVMERDKCDYAFAIEKLRKDFV